MSDCIFCKIIAREIPASVVAETDDILVIRDINPKAQTHLLIMPKKHIKDISSFERGDCCLGSKMLSMAQKLSQEIAQARDFKLIINNGYAAGQRIFHVHAHFLAGSTLPEIV